MPALLDDNNTSMDNTPVQYKEMGGGAMPTRLDEKNTCTVQTYTNPVGARVEHDIEL